MTNASPFILYPPGGGTGGGSAGTNTLGMSNLGNTSGTSGVIAGTALRLLLAGGNNITLSQSINGSTATITISAFNQSVQTQMTGLTAGMSTGGNTSGTTGLVSNRMVFVGGNNITLSQSVNGDSATLTISAFTQTVQTQMTGLTAGMSTEGNTAGTTGLVSNRLVIVGSDNITLSQSVNGGSATLSIFGATAAGGANTLGASNLGNTSGTSGVISGAALRFVLAGGNNITLSQSINGSSATITVSAFNQSVQTQMTGLSAGMSTGGNTSGTTGIVSNRLVLVGGDNITLSQSVNGDSATLTISGGAGGAQTGTISQWPFWPMYGGPVLTATLDSGASGGTGGSTQWTASGRMWPIDIPCVMHWNELIMPVQMRATANGTGSGTIGHIVGIYTLNGNTALSLASSYVWTMAWSQNSISARTHRWGWGGGTNSDANSSNLQGGISASVASTRMIFLNQTNQTLGAGRYYLMHMMTQRTSSTDLYYHASLGEFTTYGGHSSLYSVMGQADLSQMPGHFGGVFSTTSNGSAISNLVAPASIDVTNITRTGGSSQWKMPWMMFQRSVT